MSVCILYAQIEQLNIYQVHLLTIQRSIQFNQLYFNTMFEFPRILWEMEWFTFWNLNTEHGFKIDHVYVICMHVNRIICLIWGYDTIQILIFHSIRARQN